MVSAALKEEECNVLFLFLADFVFSSNANLQWSDSISNYDIA